MIMLLLIGIYTTVICAIIFGFTKLKGFRTDKLNAEIKFSIVIPFKDEAENLPELFNSLSELNYPLHLFEVLLINDNSEDNSVALAKAFIQSTSVDCSLIHAENKTSSPKKQAITNAISKAKNEWIITTDADCTFQENWLLIYNQFILKHNTQFIASPVTYATKNTFFEAFQLLDFTSLIGVTIGMFGLKKPLMCNGANLAYTKSLFNAVNGFKGNTTIASGDDVFLLEKTLKLNKKHVHFLKNKEATVFTKPTKNLTTLISQRKRWASKTGKSNSITTKLLGLLVLATNGGFVVALLNVIIPLFNYKISIIYICIKIIVDSALIYKSLYFFKQIHFFKYYLLSAIMYPFFNTYIAFLSLFGGYKWKNRTYKR